MNSYQRALKNVEQQHLLRSLLNPSQGIDFYSNDYLGFAQNPDLSVAIKTEYQKTPGNNGATGSRLLSGNSDYAEKTEQQIAAFHNAECALVYTSGYTANLGLISSLATKETTLVCDRLIHASLIDGARLGKSERICFQHNNVDDLRNKLHKVNGQKLVIIESIYSMDGDIAPLEEISGICEQNNAMLIVDEAHAIGIFGENGEGLVQKLGLEKKVLARVMTYGKAPGIHGAAVVGPSWIKEYQVNFSRPLIFSTAPSNHHFASISSMYYQLPKAVKERDQLKKIINYFLDKRSKNDLKWLDSYSHIQSLIIPGNKKVMAVAKKLQKAGINALPIRKPSVEEGTERIRFCLHSYNTREEIDLLFQSLNQYHYEQKINYLQFQ
ncbi:MAG: 8-amino-7-oxononanoate synthase [Bacteroidota bacterium]